jgi:hypothetical protein
VSTLKLSTLISLYPFVCFRTFWLYITNAICWFFCQNAGDTDMFVYKMNFLLLCEIRQLTLSKISPFEIISRHAPMCTIIKELYRISRESPGFLSIEAILTRAVLTHFSCHQFKFGFCYTLLWYTQNETAGKMWKKNKKILISLPYLDHKNLKLAAFVIHLCDNNKHKDSTHTLDLAHCINSGNHLGSCHEEKRLALMNKRMVL